VEALEFDQLRVVTFANTFRCLPDVVAVSEIDVVHTSIDRYVIPVFYGTFYFSSKYINQFFTKPFSPRGSAFSPAARML